MKKYLKFLVVSLFVLAAVLFFKYDLSKYLDLAYLKTQLSAFQELYSEKPGLILSVFFLTYVVTTALSLPGAAILTLMAGALFGLFVGTLLVSFASTMGASLAFLSSRFVLRDWVNDKFANQVSKINSGVEKEGALYLFGLRLVPAIPFFVINLVMGLTSMPLRVFYIVSQIGMLAGTIVYVNAGTQLSKINSLSGILSPKIILSFVLLALFPFIVKRIFPIFSFYWKMKAYTKPKTFAYNMVVIGGGSAGLVSSYISSATKGKVALIERHKMGGDCLNTGCVPSKAIIRSAKFLSDIKNASKYGIKKADVEFDFLDVMNRVHKVIEDIEPHDSIERYTKLGVECFTGNAKILSPYEVEVNGKVLSTRNIVVATGASPFVPPIPGLDKIDYLTSDNLWDLKEAPKNLMVLGGGPIGSELAMAFNRLNIPVTLIEMGPSILGREDDDVSSLMEKKFISEGIELKASHKALRIEQKNGSQYLICEFEEKEVELEFDKILVAIGRKANISGFGLEELGVQTTQRGTLEVNEYLQTNIPNIYGCGDVAGPYQFTHAAAHQAWYCAVNSMIYPFHGFKVDYRVLPWCTYVDPEIAQVGLNEKSAQEQNIDVDVHKFEMSELDRAITESATEGFVKVLTVPGKDTILGATIVGKNGGELITEFISAMKHGFGLNKILGTVHIYPTLSEANKYTAGIWKKANVSEGTLSWGRRLNKFRRDVL